MSPPLTPISVAAVPASASPLLAVRGVTLQYRTQDAVVTATYRVSFDVLRSDRFVVLGPSGCGKSTLLKAVGGYLEPVEGEILLGGARRRPGPDRAFVFRSSTSSAVENGARQHCVRAHREPDAAAPRSARACSALHRQGGPHAIRRRLSHTLSGGMKQRVAIARDGDWSPDPVDGRAVCRA
jgi:NitT/TauT family transport system ATP-binding protein